MPTFHYHALNQEGQPVSGSVDAGDVQQAAADLQVLGLRIQSISIATAPAAYCPVTRVTSRSNAASVCAGVRRPSRSDGLE